MKSRTSVVVGRFQTTYLHEGHIALLNKAYIESDNDLIVILAITPDTPSLKNPFSTSVRECMIYQTIADYKVRTFATIKDYDSDHVWSHHLDIIIDSLTYNREVSIYHSRDSINGHYFGKYPLVEVKSKSKISSTRIRDQLINEERISIANQYMREVYLKGLAAGIKAEAAKHND